MSASVRGLAALALALSLCGCVGTPVLTTPEGGSVVVSSQTALELQRRVSGFYLRLQQRRFNSLETYHDFVMRGHFKTPDLFLDYYADLAEGLVGAHFERGRPISVHVEQFLFEDAQTARVQIRFVGEDDRPLRPNHVTLMRIDRWQFSDGNWWIRPERI